jgi:hypothetical protein
VPNAKITLTQTDTNFIRVAISKGDGSFHEEFLPVGPYKVSVVATGFKTLDRSGVVLSVMQSATLDLVLQIGGQSETVNVTADVPLVNLSNATLGSSVSNVQIDNLPLISRDTYALLSLVPGVQADNNSNSLGFIEYHVYINGSTDDFTGQVSYYLDGGLNMTGLRNSGNEVPDPDAVSQYDVQTNNFSAQLGRYAAAVVSMVTKSGTNQFHGSAFEFYRSRNFNATGHNVTTGKAPYVTHRFGSTFGGPIRHDKDFFFGSYGGYRYATSTLYTSAVPDVAQMQGNFSENTPTQAGDPAITSTNACSKAPTSLDNTANQFWVCNRATGFPYANNTLTTLDPTIQNVLKYLANGNLTGPLANTGHLLQNPGAFGDTKYTHHEFDPAPQTNNEYLIKTDHQLTPSHRVNLSYFRYSSSVASLPGGLTSSWTYSNYASTQQNANVSDTWTISPRTVNQAWVSYTRQFGGRIPVPSTDTPTRGLRLAPILASPAFRPADRSATPTGSA